ncbi:tyrosine-type recombinase/integrase [Nitrospina gracilis]|uniref:tyrosine-type recombinase/integrase n=1 Tax=Nitrospina gracilis TaxID=35801 RepID=UPI001F1B33F1|nr:site-specific integrase [Nitrospina gracilis]MCF8721771.1 integrase [Nitrospina gracilis Nb-211]
MYKRGNVYWCKISRPGQKPVCRSLGTDKKRAKAIEGQLRAQIHEGTFFDNTLGKSITVAQLLEMYAERYARHNKSPKSQKTDGYMGKRLNEQLGEIFIADLTPHHLEWYMDERRKAGRSEVTIHHELNLLRHAFVLALKQWDLINKNPFDKVKLPSGVNKRVRYLKPDEEKRLFEALESREWLRSVVIVARETGLRLSNICNLTWSQVDLNNRFIEIEKTKNGKPVWIPLSDAVFGELKQHHKTCDLKSDRVFIVDGKPIHRCWVGLAFRRLCKRAKVENFRFHDLRHDFCSRLVQAGLPLNVVADLAGHEDISTTQRYAHLSPETKRNAIAVLNGYKSKATG